MRRTVAPGLGAIAGLLAAAATAFAGPLDEPVTVTASAPPQVGVNAPFKLAVEVRADAGSLDIAQKPLRMRVRFAPECGGSFAGTEGPTAIDRTLPAPAAGAPYKATVGAEVTLAAPGEETICAFLEDAQERQFATDTEATLIVGAGGAATAAGCKAARKQLRQLKKRSRKIDRRIHKLRREAKQVHAANPHRKIVRTLHKLRRKRHKLIVRSRKAKHSVAVSCKAGGRR